MSRKLKFMLWLVAITALVSVQVWRWNQGHDYRTMNRGDYVLTQDAEQYWRLCKVIEPRDAEGRVKLLMFPDRSAEPVRTVDLAEFSVARYAGLHGFVPLTENMRPAGTRTRVRNFIYLTNAPVTDLEIAVHEGRWPFGGERAGARKNFAPGPAAAPFAPVRGAEGPEPSGR